MKTREQMIKQINSAADSWGIPRPKITKQTSDEALRKLCRKLDREGKELGTYQAGA